MIDQERPKGFVWAESPLPLEYKKMQIPTPIRLYAELVTTEIGLLAALAPCVYADRELKLAENSDDEREMVAQWVEGRRNPHNRCL